MGKYYGPPLGKLPEEIRSRVSRINKICEKSSTLGLDIKTEYFNKRIEEKMGEYKEIYSFDGEILKEAYFKIGEKIYEIFFAGSRSRKENKEIIKALEFEKQKFEEIKELATDDFNFIVAPGPYFGKH